MTFDDVSCLLHLPIKGRLLGHERITKYEALEMMVDYLGADLEEEKKQLDKTRGEHAIFEYLKKVYREEL